MLHPHQVQGHRAHTGPRHILHHPEVILLQEAALAAAGHIAEDHPIADHQAALIQVARHHPEVHLHRDQDPVHRALLQAADGNSTAPLTT